MIEEVNKLYKGIIEIKKQVTYERKDKSKVLIIHVIESEVEEIDLKLFNSMFAQFSYLSYKYSTLI